jgi:acyl-CoA thioesterase FadM
MEITTLTDLLRDGSTKAMPNGLSVHVSPSMIISGEDRLSYTTVVRLVECCRELHWQKDILSYHKQNQLDSICKSITADFNRPILLGSDILITYAITEIRGKSYCLRFRIAERGSEFDSAVIEIVCVFYNPLTRTAVKPPPLILNRLAELRTSATSMQDGRTKY